MYFKNLEMPTASAKTNSAKTDGKIDIRRPNSDDLKNVLTFFATHVNVAKKRESGFNRRLLLSYIFNEPFSFLGEDTFTGSLAETKYGQVIGTIFVRRFPFGKSWILGPIAVHPNFRGSGLATHMMAFTMKLLRKKKARLAILSVQTSNIQARKFFEKSDFEYLKPVFANHEQARKYVQMFTFISGYFRNTRYRIEQYPMQTRIAHSDQKPEANRLRTWCIMLRTL